MDSPSHPYDWAIDTAPTVIWHTVENGSLASAMMSFELLILPGGYGSRTDFTSQYPNRVWPFIWRFEGPGEMHFFEPCAEYPEPLSPEDWNVCKYRAQWVPSGRKWALINDKPEADEGWQPGGGFWTLFFPIALTQRFYAAPMRTK